MIPVLAAGIHQIYVDQLHRTGLFTALNMSAGLACIDTMLPGTCHSLPRVYAMLFDQHAAAATLAAVIPPSQTSCVTSRMIEDAH